jgi:hypothetical protein
MGRIAPENVFTIRNDRISASVGDAFQAIYLIRKLRIDAAIDLEFFARSSAALSFLSGARYRVGFHAFGGDGGIIRIDPITGSQTVVSSGDLFRNPKGIFVAPPAAP